jgi:hypothetical protein
VHIRQEIKDYIKEIHMQQGFHKNICYILFRVEGDVFNSDFLITLAT